MADVLLGYTLYVKGRLSNKQISQAGNRQIGLSSAHFSHGLEHKSAPAGSCVLVVVRLFKAI